MTHLVATYGYLAVFVLVAAESLGLPVPGETALIVAASYAGHTGRLSGVAVWGAAAVGTVIGDNLGYLAGAYGGARLLRRWGPRLHLSPARIKVGWYVFDRHGGKVVFLGRFVSILRTYAAFLAGANRMPWRRFLPANAAGGIVWAAVYTAGAFRLGGALTRVSADLAALAVAGLVVASVIVALTVRGATARLAARAEAAFPGPIEGVLTPKGREVRAESAPSLGGARGGVRRSPSRRSRPG